MFATFRRRWAVLALVLLALAVPAFVAADHSWGPYHWARTSNPLPLDVGDNVSSVWDPFLDQAIGDWNQSSVLDLTEVTGGTKPKPCKPTSGQIEVCSSRYGNNGWLGIAQIWITGGEHITQAITKVNDTYHDQAPYNTAPWRALVMCQEIGHDFGLDHQDENFNNANLGTCMDYTSDPDGPPSNEHPNSHDYQQLASIYAHLDDFNSWSLAVGGQAALGVPPAMSQIDFAGPAQWGRLVRLSPSGAYAIFELDFGGGNKVLTHVTWTVERAGELAQLRDSLSR
jgi:hypothetical protein